jgi:hypothetical protein
VIHVLTLLDVDGRDVGAKQSFVASPGTTERARFALLPGRLRALPNFFKRINLIWAVQSHFKKLFRFAADPNHLISLAVSSHQRGGSRSSRTRGGMQWTQAAPLTNGAEADGEVVWS